MVCALRIAVTAWRHTGTPWLRLTDTVETPEQVRNKTPMQQNVKRISTTNSTMDEINAQRAALQAAERRLARLAARGMQAREKINDLRRELAGLRARGRNRATPATVQEVRAASSRMAAAVRRRDKLLSDYRELKLFVREQRALCSKLEKKQQARQRAVEKFLREWERNYDRELRMKERNARKRKRLTGD
jgi:hypothetical protein